MKRTNQHLYEKNFRRLLDIISSTIECYDDHNYQRIYRGYNRLLKKIVSYLDGKDNEGVKQLKYYFAAIYIMDETAPNGIFSPLRVSCFLSHCLKKNRKYNLTVPDSEMSFFLSFFLPDSELFNKIEMNLSDAQVCKLRQLNKDKKSSSEDRFKRLIEIITEN